MRRIITLLLSLIVALCFVSCSKAEKQKQSKIGIDVEYYAKAGQIPECEYHLGQNVDEMLLQLQQRQEAAEEELGEGTHHHSAELDKNFYYHNEEMGLIITYGENGCTYRYDTDEKQKGITHIISSNTAYEFEVSDVSTEIKKAMSSYGFNTEERALTENEISYYGAAENATALEYKFSGKTVLFIFNDNALFATALYYAD
ncbi:MAG: hypothetical protein J6J13_06905 [Clostridia bacterium]|nr:hypothetical protein [Clostridia bacterium]